MASTTVVGRVASLAAIVAAVAVAAYLLFGGGGAYVVNAHFQNAGQIVKGNEVEVAGRPAGSIKDIRITDDGQAEIEMEIDERFAPLRRGTKATVRQTSQSGVANRYVELELGPATAAEIADGGVLAQTETVSSVDIDQLFNTFDPETRDALKHFLRGSADQWRGRGAQANEGFEYLSPFFASSSRLFRELNRDTRTFERFVVDSAKLMTALAERRDDLSSLVGDLDQAMGAIGRRKESLASAVNQLPDFMRRANTTFVNLRGTLGDLDPLVAESKPVAPKLTRFLRELRPFARDAEPAIAALNDIVRKKGADNDLVELNRLQPALTKIAAGPVDRNGKERKGAFPISVDALKGSMAQFEQFRPYTPELVAWFDGFSHPADFDANGGIGRIAPVFNAFTFSTSTGTLGAFIPPSQRAQNFRDVVTIGQVARCPGANERPTTDKSVPFTDGGKVKCDPTQMPPGP